MGVKCSVFIATSVDGFIARKDGSIDWLEKPEFAAQDELGLDYDHFISGIDSIIMGRNTFEKALSFSSWPYQGIPVIVLSSQKLEIPDHLTGEVSQERGEPGEIVSRITALGSEHLYIDGANTIQRFIEARLINEITITRVPLLLGSGIALFASAGTDCSLHHVQTSAARNGLVQSQYRVVYGELDDS